MLRNRLTFLPDSTLHCRETLHFRNFLRLEFNVERIFQLNDEVEVVKRIPLLAIGLARFFVDIVNIENALHYLYDFLIHNYYSLKVIL